MNKLINNNAEKVKSFLDATKTDNWISNVTKHEKRNIKNNEKDKAIDKEIIRRLRIQNKKLIEQVVKLKEEIKKTKFNKNEVLKHVTELLDIIGRKNNGESHQ